MTAAVKSPTFHPPSPSHSQSALMSAPFAPSTSSNNRSSIPDPTSPATAASNRRSVDSTGRLLPQPFGSHDASSPTSAGPSPIAPSSNGTEIDDTASDDDTIQRSESLGGTSSVGTKRSSVTVITKDEHGETLKTDSPEANPTSVIHAPRDYLSFSHQRPNSIGRTTPVPPVVEESSEQQSPGKKEEDSGRQDIPIIVGQVPLSPPPIDTAVRPVHDPYATPRASVSKAEFDSERKERGRKPSLENIPEDSAVEDTEDERPQSAFFESEADRLRRSSEEVAALKDALSECWTLCNTLAGLSSLHREKAFRQARREDKRELAWKSCWKLCQKLYENRQDEQDMQAAPILDLCREFCQTLFDVRQKGDDVADSVLRVSFELNNHLYNTHDRNLPDVFRERTLDFYITLCHRLMKQRNAMVEEADSLLRACWGLAEMLFSLRQNRRDGQPPNEELLGSAVQACWELCDLFREGWKQIRPDRGTPRPSSIGFSHFSSSSSMWQFERPKSAATINIGESSDEDDTSRLNPETPTTIFEDVNQLSPDEASLPNILVLGPETSNYTHPPWSSSASDAESHYSSASSRRSGRSRGSTKIGPGPASASTSTTARSHDEAPDGSGPNDAARLACLKLLMVRAAQITGFDRAKDPSALQQYIKSLPSGSFGAAAWQSRLLDDFKKLVASDPAFRSAGPATKARASDIARAVRWMVRSGQYVWLEDLYRWVLGFRVEEAKERGNDWVQT